MSALLGKRVLVTRAMHQAGELQQLLDEQGAVPLLYPCIKLAPPVDEGVLRSALSAAVNGAFDWLILTSSNTVFVLKQQFDAMDVIPPYLPDVQVAAVGASTAEAAQQLLGLQINFIPETYTASALAETLNVAADQRVLLPQSSLADNELALALSNRGALVTRVVAYEMVIGSGGVDLVSNLEAGSIDAITFTSASTVKNFVQRLTAEGGSVSQLSSLCIACIGPNTEAAVSQYSFPTPVTADEYTLKGLVTALEGYFTKTKMGEPK